MPYPNHFLLQFGGLLHGGSEQWSMGLRLRGNTGQSVTNEVQAAYAEDAYGDIAAWLARTTSGPSVNCTLEYVKMNAIDGNGHYADTTTTNVFYPTSTVATGNGAASQAPQVAVVVTLHTEAQRGYASKGRVYIPSIKYPVAADGLMSTTVRDGIATSFQTLINALNNNPGLDAEFGGLDVHVVSPGGGTGVGVARKVTGISVGRVMDTQRRRRRSLPEGARTILPVS